MAKRKDLNPKRSTHQEVKPTPEQQWELYRRHRRFVRLGQAIMLAGFIIALQHWFAHLGMFGAQPPGWVDIVAGYPMGAAVLAIGAIIAGRKAP
jgi:hypothetical protein